MELSEQEQVRRQSLQTMRDMGIDPYPAAEYVVTGYSADIKTDFDNWDGKEVRIAGRLMSKRIMGKASFIELQDSKGCSCPTISSNVRASFRYPFSFSLIRSSIPVIL